MKKTAKLSALFITFAMILTGSAYADMSIATPYVGFENNFDSMLADGEDTNNISLPYYQYDYMVAKPAQSGTTVAYVSGLQDDGTYDSVDGSRNPYLKAHVAAGETTSYLTVNHNYNGGYVPSTGKVVYSFDMRITPPETINTSSNYNVNNYTITSRDNDGALAVGMGFSNFSGGKFNLRYLRGNTSRWMDADTTKAFDTNTWYRYRIELDMNTGKASYYVFSTDGELKGKYENVDAIGSLNSKANLSMRFNFNYADDTDISLDNIKIEAEQFTVSTGSSSSTPAPVIETVSQNFANNSVGAITSNSYYDTFSVIKSNDANGSVAITDGKQSDETYDSVDGTNNKYIKLTSKDNNLGYSVYFNHNSSDTVTSGKIQYDFDMRLKTSTAQSSYSLKSVSGTDTAAKNVGMIFNFANNGTYTIGYLQSKSVGERWSDYDTKTYNSGSWYHYTILMDVDTGIATYKIYDGETLVNTYTSTASVNKDVASTKRLLFFAGWGTDLETSIDNLVVKSGQTLEEVPSECPIKLENGKYTITADVYNNIYATSGNTTSPTLILASYDKDGSLIEVKAASADVAMRGSATADSTHAQLTAEVDASNTKIASVRAFVWKNLTEIVPITDSIPFTE